MPAAEVTGLSAIPRFAIAIAHAAVDASVYAPSGWRLIAQRSVSTGAVAPSIVQLKTGYGSATLDSPVTPGNLIVALLSMRPSTGGTTGVMAGSGWTTVAEGSQSDFGSGCREALIQAKVASDSTQAFNYGGSGGNSVAYITVYELDNASLSDFSILEQDDGARTQSPDLGAFASAASGSVALAVITVNAENQTLTPTSGHADLTADFEGPVFGSQGHPWGFHYHGTGDGSDLDVDTTLAVLPNDTGGAVDGEWSGAAVLFDAPVSAVEVTIVGKYIGEDETVTSPFE
jgi:hypothetical protein